MSLFKESGLVVRGGSEMDSLSETKCLVRVASK